MKLSLDALEVLDAIDRRGSFAAAAEELHRVPSAITYSVQQLEEGLDLLLFDRTGHRAKLTEAGRELLNEGRHLLRAAADLECRVQQVAKGWESELRIAIDTMVGLEKLFGIVAEFYDQNPGTDISVEQMTANKPTKVTKGIRLGNFVQIRGIIDEELEAVWAGKKAPKEALDEAVKRGNEQLRRFEQANKGGK